MTRHPSRVRKMLDDDQARLYELIWKRAVSSQMASAELERTTVEIEAKGSDGRTLALRATGSVLVFDGFLVLYQEGKDDDADEEDRRLPPIERGDRPALTKIDADQHFTEPPPRYTEATLIKRLEELGIGRPSTYSATLGVLQDREYVRLDKRRLVPDPKGRLVTAFLESFFKRYVEYDFTADLEEKLDEISAGHIEWRDVLRDFWRDFISATDEIKDLRVAEVLEALNEILGPSVFPAREDGGDPRACPSCATGRLSLKVGRYGAFVGCSNYPECRYTKQLGIDAEQTDPELAEGKVLGTDPETGRTVTLRSGRFGPFVQLGEAEDGEKPPRSSLPKGTNAADVDLELALKLLSLPRFVGTHPETGEEIVAGLGRYGPFVRHEKTFANLDSFDEVFTVGLNRAVALLAEKKERGGRRPAPQALKELGEREGFAGPIVVRAGRYGPYVTDGKINATLPKDANPEELTIERAVELLEAKAATKGKGKKAPAKSAGKSTGKATTKSTAKSDAKKPRRQEQRREARGQEEGARQVEPRQGDVGRDRVSRRRSTPGDIPTLPSREQILDFVRSQPGKVGKREIAKAFDVSGSDKIGLKQLLREMAEDGEIERRGKRLRKAGALAPVEVVEVTHRDRDGELVAVPTDWDEEAHGAPPHILIMPDRGRSKGRRETPPGVGDHVLARISEPHAGETVHHARIIKVIERKPKTVIGVVTATADGGGILRSVNKKDRHDLSIEPGDMGEAKDGDLVSVEVRRGRRLGPPRAIVRERIGDMQTEHAVSLIALLTHDIPVEFPEEAVREAERAKPAPFAKREDLRKVPLVTIDPPDAKDHDDAIYAEPDPEVDGGWIVYVAIADVAHYVPHGSALDRSALERGNSVYFPDRVVPMLPEKLSGDLCSLMVGEDRAAMVAVMKIAPDGRKTSHRFTRAMIRVAANVHYVQAQEAVDGKPDAETETLVEPVLKPLWQAYEAMARARDARDPLELEIPERKLVLSKDGRVDRVIVPPRLTAHRLVEVFMIAANVAAAETLEEKRTPLLYRVHDSPSPEKLAALSDFLASIDMKLPKAGVLLPSHFNGILRKVEGTENERLVHEVVLRSQAQAEYSPQNFGHFGLNLRRYAHFTSPIRRYADLIVHRALIRALDLGRDGLSDEEIGNLDEIAAQISATERRAMAAERETVDRLIANFLADQIGATFTARIGGVTRAGIFVRLADTGADGFVPAGTIGQDYYRYDEAGQRMVGQRTGETYTLGDEVTVRLVEAAPLAGALRFELVSEGRYLSKKPGAPRSRPPKGRKPVGKGRKAPARRKR